MSPSTIAFMLWSSILFILIITSLSYLEDKSIKKVPYPYNIGALLVTSIISPDITQESELLDDNYAQISLLFTDRACTRCICRCSLHPP